MSHITVNNEQARIIAESSEMIEIRDQTGAHLGFVAHGVTEEDILICKQRMETREPGRTTQEVLDHLRSLGAE